MSKKIAAGAQAIVLDVKVGDGAFMRTLPEARELAEAMRELGTRAGREVVCLLTDMDQPLGRAVGNALEIREAIATIRGEGPPDFTELVLAAASRLVALSDLGLDERGRARAGRGRRSPTARPRTAYRRWITAQGGDPTRSGFRRRPSSRRSSRRDDGVITRVRALPVGIAALELGAGRRAKGDEIDHSVGVVLLKKRGDRVSRGEPLAEVHARDEASAAEAARAAPSRDRARRASRPRAPASSWTSSASVRTMPELPEVETVRRGLEPVARRPTPRPGRDPRRPARAAVRAASRWPPSSTGEVVERLERRGKYLIFRFESGRVLLVHLRMTGSFVHAPAGSLPDDPYRRAVLTLDNGSDVAYRDVRRFGTWLLLEPG